MSDFLWLTLLIFLPAIGGAVLLAIPARAEGAIRWLTVAVCAVTLCLACLTLTSSADSPQHFQPGYSGWQHVVSHPWIPSFDINYLLGLDGISFPLVLLTALLVFLGSLANWSVTKNIKFYSALYLLLGTGMLGVFVALDAFLFYVFFEVVLLPLYFLIGIWGGPRKEYAALKFFLFTLMGSVLILIGLLMLYFASDLRALTPQQLTACFVPPQVQQLVEAARNSGHAVHTFNIIALQTLGQQTEVFNVPLLFGASVQAWAFVLLTLGFLIKVPSVPFHTWLPDAHVEAPTPVSMLLAGVLLKLGGYGLIRLAIPICPLGAYYWAIPLGIIGVISIWYGGLAALAQTDFKRLVAYSSVSHMGYVVLGLAAWSATAENFYDHQYFAMGLNGAMFQMIAHGITSAGMFFLVGVLYDRVHHRDLLQFGAVYHHMPIFSGLAFGIFFAALGLPGLCGFIGEVLVILAAWKFSAVLCVLSALALVLSAGYFLQMLQQVFFGPEYRGTDRTALKEIGARETFIAAPLMALALCLGIFPDALFRYLEPAATQTAKQLAGWTKRTQLPRDRAAFQAAAVNTSAVNATPVVLPVAVPESVPAATAEATPNTAPVPASPAVPAATGGPS